MKQATKANTDFSAARFLVLGVVLLGLGLMAAWRWQPEWQVDDLGSKDRYASRFIAAADDMGFSLPNEPPRIELRSFRHHQALDRALGAEFFEFQRRINGGLQVLGTSPAIDEEGRRGRLEITFDLAARPIALTWDVFDVEVLVNPNLMKGWPALGKVQSVLMRTEERLGEVILGEHGAAVFYGADLEGAETPQYLTWGTGPSVQVHRMFGEIDEYRDNLIQRRLSQVLLFFVRRAVLLITVGLLLVFLLIRRRVDPINGALLGFLAILSFFTTGTMKAIGFGGWLPVMVYAVCWSSLLFFLWSVGESWVRTSNEQRSEAIDALRGGRLGPHVGRALASGLIGGAALAGLRMASIVIAGALGGIVSTASPASLPLATTDRNPLVLGIFVAGLALFGLGLALKLVPVRWRTLAAIPAMALVLLEVAPIEPWPAALVVTAAFASIFMAVFRRGGILGVLVAGVTSTLWPLAALSLRHLNWLGGSALLAGLPLVALAALAWYGLRRPGDVDQPRLHQPAFLRRLDRERRLRYEMGLLARMQSALLPARTPNFDGWDLAATSMFANEVGGDLYDFMPDDNGHLWIAAGDVAGHGYSCAIGHAMTKAVLASTISNERRPSEVLIEIDRVLRTLNSDRWFTALVLVRLELATGQALVANAGYPYPLMVAAGEATEIEIPGLPLGQGPLRTYHDHPIELPPGATLVLFSDGLFEALDSSGSEAYGFERPAAVLASKPVEPLISVKPAAYWLDQLMADWRLHCGGAEATDDTTVVVVHRQAR